MMRFALSCVFVVLSTLGVARADKHHHEAGKVEIDVPGTWKVKKDKGMLVGESKDQAVGLMFWVVDKGNVDDAIGLLDKALAGKVTDVKWPRKPEAADLNGLRGIKNVGAARIKGKDSFIMVAVLGPTPSKKGVIVFGAIEQAKLTEHKAELENIFASLRPMK